MKLFNIENGVEKVYVQLDDLLTLYKTEQYIPISIFEKVFDKGIVIEDDNRFSFIEFYDKEEIDFFKAIDWIVDGKQLNKMNSEELGLVYKDAANDVNNYLENNKSSFLVDDTSYEYEVLRHRLNSIKNFFRAKYGNLKMPFPEVTDSDGLLIDDISKSGLLISESLNPNSIVMTKVNGDRFYGKDPLNNQLINKGLEKVRSKRKIKDDRLFEYKTKYDLSEDLKSFVIKYREGKCKTEKEEQKEFERSNKMKRLLKKMLKKRDD